MAELEYALVAEYARLDSSGLLTVVGAGFDKVTAESLPAFQPVAVAMRVLLSEDEKSVPWVVKWALPKGQTLTVGGQTDIPTNALPVDGKVGVGVAMNLTLPLATEGFYRVTVELAGIVKAERGFYVEAASSSQPQDV